MQKKPKKPRNKKRKRKEKTECCAHGRITSLAVSSSPAPKIVTSCPIWRGMVTPSPLSLSDISPLPRHVSAAGGNFGGLRGACTVRVRWLHGRYCSSCETRNWMPQFLSEVDSAERAVGRLLCSAPRAAVWGQGPDRMGLRYSWCSGSRQ